MSDKDNNGSTEYGFVPAATPQQPLNQGEETLSVRLTGGFIPPSTPIQPLKMEGFVPPTTPVPPPVKPTPPKKD